MTQYSCQPKHLLTSVHNVQNQYPRWTGQSASGVGKIRSVWTGTEPEFRWQRTCRANCRITYRSRSGNRKSRTDELGTIKRISLKKKPSTVAALRYEGLVAYLISVQHCTRGGTRTPTGVTPLDPKSSVSTNSTTLADKKDTLICNLGRRVSLPSAEPYLL